MAERTTEPRRRRARGDGSLYPYMDGWRAVITVGYTERGTQRKKYFWAKTQREAKAKRDEYLRIHGNTFAGRGERAYLEDYINTWFLTVKKNALKPSTYEREARTIKNYIVPYLGRCRLVNLRTDVVQNELINRLVNENNTVTGKPNSFSLIRQAYYCLRDCMNYAVENGDIAVNPCNNSITLPLARRAEAREKRTFSDEEISKFVEACHSQISKYEWLYEFILYTGLREGEACALKLSDIDYEQKRIYVHGTIVCEVAEDGKKKGGFTYQNRTKTNTNRYVYLGKPAVKLLEEHANACEPENYIANNSDKPVNLSYLNHEYKKVCDRAGIEGVHGLHDLRHTCASTMIRRGVDVKTVSEQLGHTSAAFTLKTYVHTVESDKLKKIESIW
jgi:integrase